MLDHNDYHGPRWRYGNQYRPCPIGYWSYAQKNTFILGSQHTSPNYPQCPFGLFDLSEKLLDKIADQQQLLFIGRVYTPRERLANVRQALANLEAGPRVRGRADAIRSARAQLAEYEARHAAGTLEEIIDDGDVPF